MALNHPAFVGRPPEDKNGPNFKTCARWTFLGWRLGDPAVYGAHGKTRRLDGFKVAVLLKSQILYLTRFPRFFLPKLPIHLGRWGVLQHVFSFEFVPSRTPLERRSVVCWPSEKTGCCSHQSASGGWWWPRSIRFQT